MDSCSGLVDLLVYANRILAVHGIVDAMGHISVRHPLRPDLFFLSRSLAPAQVKRQDILCFDLDGNDVTGSGLHPYLERFIHAEMYRAKPEVVSVVHSHSPSVIPFGVTKTDLRPIYHMAGFLGDGAAHFDIGEHGDTDMLVRDSYLGKALAKTMGDRSETFLNEITEHPEVAHAQTGGDLYAQGPEALAKRYADIAYFEVKHIYIDQKNRVTVNTVNVVYQDGTSETQQCTLRFEEGDKITQDCR